VDLALLVFKHAATVIGPQDATQPSQYLLALISYLDVFATLGYGNAQLPEREAFHIHETRSDGAQKLAYGQNASSFDSFAK
jgi:hypothetical protein